jgi:hypothetical protein
VYNIKISVLVLSYTFVLIFRDHFSPNGEASSSYEEGLFPLLFLFLSHFSHLLPCFFSKMEGGAPGGFMAKPAGGGA